MKLLNRIAGIDDEVMRGCPGVDHLWATQLGISLIIAFCFVSSLSYYSLSYFLHSEPAKVSISILIASVVTLFDRALFQSDWFYMGLVQQIREALRTQPRNDKYRIVIRYVLRILFRLTISLLIAYTLSLFVEIAVFGGAITEKIDAKFKADNAIYYQHLQDAGREIDTKIAAIESRIGVAEALIDSRDQRIQGIMSDDDRRIYDHDWGAIKIDQGKIRMIESQISENEKSIRRWNDDIQAEINGVKLRPENTGKTGCGPVCKTRKGVIENAKSENAALTARKGDLAKEIKQLEIQASEIAKKYERAETSY